MPSSRGGAASTRPARLLTVASTAAEHRLVHLDHRRDAFALDGQLAVDGAAREHLAGAVARRHFDRVPARRQPQPQIKSLGVDRLDLPRPGIGAADAVAAGKSGHARQRHRQPEQMRIRMDWRGDLSGALRGLTRPRPRSWTRAGYCFLLGVLGGRWCGAAAARPWARGDACCNSGCGRWRRAALLDHAQPRDVALMLLVVLRERMAAGAVGHEVELPRARRIGGRFDRRAPGIGDRPGRQAIDHDRCCRASAVRDPPATAAGRACLCRRQAVDDGRIGLQPHLLLEAVDEHRGDARALLGPAGLLLDDGGEDDELLRRAQRQVAGAAFPDLLHQLRCCACCMRWIACSRVIAAPEVVAVRQQPAFTRHVLDGAGQDRTVEQPRHDLLGGQTLRDGDEVLDHLAFDQGLDHVAHACALGEQVFAGLELAARALSATTPPMKTSLCSSMTPSRCRMSAISTMPARAGMLTILSSASGPGASKRCLPNDDRDAARDHRQDQQREDRVADDHQRIAHSLGAACRHRHMLRLERGARTARRDAFVHRAACRIHQRLRPDMGGYGSPASRTARVAGFPPRWPAAGGDRDSMAVPP